MSDRRLKACIIALGFVLTLPAAAASKEEERVADAADVLDQFLRIPEKSIPPTLLARAYAVAVIPNVIKIGLGVGVRRGKGIIVIRQDNHTWSNPAFIKITGGSFGWQAGVQSADIILVFKSRKGVGDITNGKLTLGANASIAAGPVGRHTEVATDWEFKAEVVSYARTRGLFVGISLEGTGVTMDRKANVAFYGSATMTPEKIFASSPNIAPNIANTFVQTLTAQTRRLPTSPGMQINPIASPITATDNPSAVRTYGLPSSGSQNR